MRQNVSFKLFFTLVITVSYLLASTKVATWAYESFVGGDKFAEGTMIGPIDVSNRSADEAYKQVNEKVNEWKQSATMTLVLEGKEATLQTNAFTFHIEESMKQAVSGKTTPLLVSVDHEALQQAITSIGALGDWMDVEKVKAQLEHEAASLTSARLSLSQYVREDMQQQTILSQVVIPLYDELHVMSQTTIVVEPKQMFSVLDFFKRQGISLSKEAMTQFASALYEAIVPTNFEVIERHTSVTLHNGVKAGFEAAVEQNKKDFIFFNPNDQSYTIEVRAEDGQMKVALVGIPFIYQYAVKTDPIEYYDPKTIVQYSALLKPNEKRIKEEGKKGMLIRLHKEVYDRNGSFIEKVLVSEDFYPPVHRVELRGLQSGGDNGIPNDTPSTQSPQQDDVWGNENEQIKGNEDDAS
ncbi:putative vancomycin resistance protein [Anoxybacillus thermarum]|uniref:Putative vancomycin resistance protein n=1 Tax=Anoxybacillus thermarum TaxID=404937 RepID=A0A0D0QZH6_9BACL|nr:VanW family protein [Anoxybacillus thermarum]KIQ94889.1 putative vancomycin resistance protein [Anoxybacillus thermarum]